MCPWNAAFPAIPGLPLPVPGILLMDASATLSTWDECDSPDSFDIIKPYLPGEQYPAIVVILFRRSCLEGKRPRSTLVLRNPVFRIPGRMVWFIRHSCRARPWFTIRCFRDAGRASRRHKTAMRIMNDIPGQFLKCLNLQIRSQLHG
jgi:hypothetical protein